MSDCIFCKNLPRVMENDLAYVILDIHPISKGHALIIPKRHVEQIFECTPEEGAAMRALVMAMKITIDAAHHPDGTNIWVNSGTAAGQVVMHAHIHLIPRYAGQPIHVTDHMTDHTRRP